MPAPTPAIKTFYDAWRGQVRWYAAWTDASNLTDSVLVDVSSFTPNPNFVKLRFIDLILNGDFSVKFEFDDVANGTVDTTNVGSNKATWVSGNKFDTTWLTLGNDTITINAVSYTISSVDSTTQITLASDPGIQTGVAYSVDEFVDRFEGQTDASHQIVRVWRDGPNGGLTPTQASATSASAGDLILTTTGVANLDELSLILNFER